MKGAEQNPPKGAVHSSIFLSEQFVKSVLSNNTEYLDRKNHQWRDHCYQITCELQLTPGNLNLQWKSKKVRVIGG